MFSIAEAAGHLPDVSKEKTALQSREGKYYRSLIFKEKTHPSPGKKNFDKILALIFFFFQFLEPNVTGRAGNFLSKRIIMISLITLVSKIRELLYQVS